MSVWRGLERYGEMACCLLTPKTLQSVSEPNRLPQGPYRTDRTARRGRMRPAISVARARIMKLSRQQTDADRDVISRVTAIDRWPPQPPQLTWHHVTIWLADAATTAASSSSGSKGLAGGNLVSAESIQFRAYVRYWLLFVAASSRFQSQLSLIYQLRYSDEWNIQNQYVNNYVVLACSTTRNIFRQ